MKLSALLLLFMLGPCLPAQVPEPPPPNSIFIPGKIIFLCALHACPDPPYQVTFLGATLAAVDGVPTPQPAIEANFSARLASFSNVLLFAEMPAVFGFSHAVALNGTVLGNTRATFFAPSLQLRFKTGQIARPFVSIGGGLAYSSFKSSSATQAFFLNSHLGGTLQIGAGGDFYPFNSRFGLRTEVRDFYGSIAAPAASGATLRHQLIAAGGIVVRLGPLGRERRFQP